MYTSNNQLCVFISDQTQLTQIDSNITKINNIEDIFLSTDNNIVSYDKMILPTYFIKFYGGKILFMNIEDWLSNKDYLKSEQVYVVASPEELLNSNLPLSDLRKINIINP